jgi:hypothetical protein
MTCELVVPPSGPDPVAIIALIVAAAGLIWGVAWAIATHLLGGQRVKVEVTNMRGVDLGDPTKSHDMLMVTIRAIGRMPVQVSAWAVMFPTEKKGTFHVIHQELMKLQYPTHPAILAATKTPFTVEPGHAERILIPAEPLKALYETGERDFSKGFIQVSFGARRDFRDKTNLAERMGLTPKP